LFGLVTRKLKGKTMGEANCEKGENYCFFHTATPCTTCNLLSLQKQFKPQNPIKTQFATNFLMIIDY
jgi:hypothetical protein